MINAAIVGLGWWGSTLVDSVRGSNLIRFVAAATRSQSKKDQEFAASNNLTLVGGIEELVAIKDVDAIVLATPPLGHLQQIIAAAQAGKHVFSEKPLALSTDEARAAVNAVEKAGVILGLGYNRRFHPSWIDLRHRVKAGELGTILHIECTMSGPNGLNFTNEAWRARSNESPCGGLIPAGVHAIDCFIDLVGEISSVFCQSFRRIVPVDNDDTTSVLFRMKAGMSAYLATMTATAPSFRLQVYGSAGMAALGGSVHVVGQSSHQRRSGLFGSYLLQPVKGEAQMIEVPEFDVNRAELESFAMAIDGGTPFPISHEQMVHGVAVTEAIVRSARTSELQRITL